MAYCKKETAVQPATDRQKTILANAVAAYPDTVVTSFFRRQTGHIAGDGGFTIPMSNGRVLWLMGDSHIDDYRAADNTMPYLFEARNAALLQPFNNWKWQQTATLTGTGTPKSYLKNTTDNNYWIWPSSGFQYGSYLYIYCAYLQKTTGGFGFGPAGRDLFAKVRITDMQPVSYGMLPDFKGITFGLSFIKDPASDYMYVFGNRQTFIYNDIFLARFRMISENPLWTYWDGKGFNIDIAKIKRVGEAMSSGVHVTRVRDKFVIISSEFSVGCNQGTRIYISTSNSPVGPYTANKAIYTIPDMEQGNHPFFYAPVLHPEYINERNEVLLTYAIGGYPGCLPDHDANNRSNPDWSRLRGVRIPYAIISGN